MWGSRRFPRPTAPAEHARSARGRPQPLDVGFHVARRLERGGQHSLSRAVAGVASRKQRGGGLYVPLLEGSDGQRHTKAIVAEGTLLSRQAMYCAIS